MMKKWLIVYEYSPDEYYAEVYIMGRSLRRFTKNVVLCDGVLIDFCAKVVFIQDVNTREVLYSDSAVSQ